MGTKTIGIIVVILAIVGIIWASQSKKVEREEEGETTAMEENGRVVFAITDETAAIDNVSEVRLTVSKIEMQSSTEGWITVSSATREYALLDLKSKAELALAADAETAIQSRAHDDTNVLSMPADEVNFELAKKIITAWLNTPFSNREKYKRRIEKIE